MEWTVKFTQAGQADLFAAAEAHFETLWNDPEFKRFDPQNDVHRLELRRALQQAKGASYKPTAHNRRAEKRSAFRRMTPIPQTARSPAGTSATPFPLPSGK